MVEWLILLLLVPAIVIPVVLLVGFAGCALESEGEGGAPLEMVSAIGANVRAIVLTWVSAATPPETFQFKRTKLLADGSETSEVKTFEAGPFPGPSPFEFWDTNDLDPATSYSYQVSRMISGGSFSDLSNAVTGTTLAFVPTFLAVVDADGNEAPLPNSEAGWEGYTLVQRIEAAQLSTSGKPVRITLRASTDSDTSIDRLYISQPASPAPGVNEYDSGADLTVIHDIELAPIDPLTVPMGQTVTREGDYGLFKDQPLLIAVDFSAAPPSGIGYIDVPPEEAEEAVAYWQNVEAEAKVTPRIQNYEQTPGRIYLVEKIEVGQMNPAFHPEF